MPFLSEVASVNADVAGLSSIGTHPNVCRDAPLIAHLPDPVVDRPGPR